MSKQSVSGVVASTKTATKGMAGNRKKVAKTTMISSWDEVNNMTVAEFSENVNRLDFDKLVNYKADPYYVKADKNQEHPKEAFFCPTDLPDKPFKFIGQSDAMAIGSFIERNPIVAMMQLIAYKKGNPYT